MRILVTGSTGYLGGRLTRMLITQGHEVHAVNRGPGGLPGLAGIHGDPGDGSQVGGIIDAIRPALIYHLATCYRWDHTPADLPGMLDCNLVFSIKVAEAAARTGAVMVNAGSGFQHAGGERRPASLYAVTKQAFMDALDWYGAARGLRTASVLLNDTYGPRDPRRKLFHLLRSAVGAAQPLAMSPGGQIIDLVHGDDAAAAFIAAGQAAVPGHRIWLAASGEAMPLRDLVSRWSVATGLQPAISWGARPYREREVMQPWLTGDPPPGWRPMIGLDEGFRGMERDP